MKTRCNTSGNRSSDGRANNGLIMWLACIALIAIAPLVAQAVQTGQKYKDTTQVDPDTASGPVSHLYDSSGMYIIGCQREIYQLIDCKSCFYGGQWRPECNCSPYYQGTGTYDTANWGTINVTTCNTNTVGAGVSLPPGAVVIASANGSITYYTCTTTQTTGCIW